MRSPPVCPRCDGDLRPPGLMSSLWACDRHGPVAPLRLVSHPSPAALHQLAAASGVPLWCPWPLPPGWSVTGLALAGDERRPAAATVLALSGPCPLGGPADLLLVAEEPGVGLGARYAGVAGPDPGPVPDGPPDAKIEAAGHPTPLWRCVDAADRCAYAGEASGVWLWLVLWPADAELVLLEPLALHDLRRDGRSADLPFGAPSPRLTGA